MSSKRIQKPDERLVPLEAAEAEFKVLNSRFLARLAPVASVEEARAFHKAEKAVWADASHHVPAFIIGHGRSLISHCSDDGEPSGTAGRPALTVLEGSGLGNVAVVVTRWFGGTKLGTGGLVQAYGDAVKAVLGVTKLAKLVHTQTVRLDLPYNLYEIARRELENISAQTLNTVFGVDVRIDARILADDLASLAAKIQEISAGRVQVIQVQDEPDTPFPL